MSKILVTGAAGFIGSHLCDALVKEGHTVLGLDSLITGKKGNINPDIFFYHGDIRDRQLLKVTTVGVDYVYHLAALARIQPSIDDPVEANSVNLTGTLNVLEACRLNGAKRIIFAGSSSTYADTDEPMNEASPKATKNPYSLQKLICEQYIELYHELYGLDYVINRYFNVYGPRQILDGAYAAVVGIFLQQRRQNTPLTITGDGSKRRDFTHVSDVTRANLMAMDAPTGVYNVGTGVNVSIKELADAISPWQFYIDERPGEAQSTLADSSKLKALGWQSTKHILDPDVLAEMDACV